MIIVTTEGVCGDIPCPVGVALDTTIAAGPAEQVASGTAVALL